MPRYYHGAAVVFKAPKPTDWPFGLPGLGNEGLGFRVYRGLGFRSLGFRVYYRGLGFRV